MNLWFLWEIGVNFVEAYFIYYLYRKQLGVFPKKQKWMIFSFFALLALVCSLNYINIQMLWFLPGGIEIYLPRIILFIANLLITIFVFNGSVSKKILFAAIPTGVSIAADSITALIASMLTNVDLNAATEFGTERFPLTILYLLSAIAIYFVIANISFSKAKKSSLHLPKYLQIFLFAILVLGIIGIDQLISVTFFIADTPNEDLNNQLIFINILFLVILFSVFILIERIGKITQKNIEYELELQQKDLEEKYYTNIEATMEAIRDARHDMKNNIQVLHGLLENKQYAELKDYLDTIHKAHITDTEIILTQNPTLNALLQSKLYLAKAEKIKFTYNLKNVDIPENSHMNMCSIFGNLLDNAIEGCKTLFDPDKRYINLIVETKKRMLCITIENTYDGIYKRSGNKFISRKKESNHGRGLNSVQKIVTEMHGHITISPERNQFIVTILLPL